MRTASAVLLVLSLSGCLNRDLYEPEAAEVRTSVRAIQASLRAVRGTFTAGGMTSIFVAYCDEKKVYLIEEAFDRSPEAKGVNRYYVDQPHLMVYEVHKTVRDVGQVVSDSRLVDLEVFFNREGAVTESRKAINGVASAADSSEIESAKQRFAQLYPEVRRQAGI